MALRRTVAPTQLPLTLTEVKAHLRVDHTEEDDLIQLLLQSATDFVAGEEGFLGRGWIDQTWQLTLDAFPENEIKIPLPPLIQVLSVGYDDASGIAQTVSSYTVDAESEPGWILPDGTWPATFDGVNAVRILFRAGYVNTIDHTGTLPGNIVCRLLLENKNLYANREQVQTGTIAVQFT